MSHTTMRQLRLAKGWSREYLAVQLHVSLSTISNLETGRHQPRMELARKIADLFGVTLDSIQWGKSAAEEKDRAAAAA